MKERVLSDWQTFFWKLVLPVLFVAPGAYLAGVLFAAPERISWNGGTAPWQAKWFTLGFLAIATVLLKRFVGSLKRLRVAGEVVFISNYLTEEEIPKNRVIRVSETQGLRLGAEHPLRVEYHENSGVPRAFTFILSRRLTYAEVEEALGLPVQWGETDGAQTGPGTEERLSLDK